MSEKTPLSRPRRWFLGHVGTALAGAGAVLAASPTTAGGQSTANPNWQPARHELDDWFDKGSAKHRFVFDAPTPDGFGGALLYANNYYTANQTGYGLQNSDLAVVMVARAVGSSANEIYDELAANLVSNSHLVPAGIVAVNRAQERGYSFVYS